MDIQSEKIELIQLLLATNDKAIIDAIKTIFEKDKQEAWEKLSPEEQAVINNEIQKENQADTADF
ncbi:hypothetical protein MW871_12910 [Flavobacterium sp. I-SCBP12n]|uniref:Uncharacterized protein n=2 Tax=Flavobacterium TaxID=237 RepID=A0A9X2BLP0_9FLAO|nr:MULTISPECIES: hypothetical protein [Flavobacterium]MBP4142926.1 hypothetical protein [Flavobacterium flabelliforme]MCK8142794.1 hypothetical protein [Flavobacterium pygoscelis]